MLGNKRTADGALDESKKKLRGAEFGQEEGFDALQGQETRFLIQNHEAGAVIGKAGSTVNSIRTSTGCSLNILKNEAKFGPYAKNRILVLNGTITAKNMAVQMMLETWLKLACDRATQRGEPAVEEYTIKVLIHKFQAGVIIGKAGAAIREMQSSTGAHMQVSNDPLPGSTERVLSIKGSLDQVNVAGARVLNILNDNPPRPGSNIPFDPNYVASPYGMAPAPSAYNPYGAPMGGQMHGQMGQMPSVPPQAYNPYQQYAPAQAMYGAPSGGAPPQSQHAMAPSHSAHGAAPDTGLTTGLGDLGDGRSEQKILIASNMAGRLIGKGGATIRDLNQQSGTHIQLSKYNPLDPAERLVTVTGPSANVSTAVYLISQLMEQGP